MRTMIQQPKIRCFRLTKLARATQCANLAQQHGYDPKEIWDRHA